jgi:hypothetical protein
MDWWKWIKRLIILAIILGVGYFLLLIGLGALIILLPFT